MTQSQSYDRHKRRFLKASAAGGLIVGSGGAGLAGMAAGRAAAASELADMTGDVSPISPDERRARINKARRLMAEANIAAVVLEPGSSLDYFTGVKWGRSERFMGAILPIEGDIAYVAPAFEEAALAERLVIGDDIRVWDEHESPFARVAQILDDRGIGGGTVGMEATVRYFIADGIAAASRPEAVVSADPVVNGCRMIKSDHEIALMQRAMDITLAAYRHVVARMESGMRPADVQTMMDDAQRAMGGATTHNSIQIGQASAYPHGSERPQMIESGKMILMDVGCSVEGYKSDISRSFVFGEPSARQREIWDLERRAQQVAFEAIEIGAPCEAVDIAARGFLESNGFGPGYETPGLPHRTGHGIGLDGHEPVNFVINETTLIQPGMCFSNEPGIYIYGEFGVRIEDCVWIAEDGPRWFTTPPPSIDDPIG